MVEIPILRHAKILMVIGGVWRQPIFKTTKTEKLYRAYAYIIQSFYLSVCFLMFTEFFYLLEGEDVKKLTDNIKITITCCLAGIKFIIFGYGNIPKLICQMVKTEKTILNLESQEVKNIYFSFVKYVNNCAIAIIVLANGTAFFLTIATIVVGLTTDGSVISKPMIFLAHFPFDQDQHYGISLILQSFCITIACVYYCMSQILYISILIFAKAQLKILQIYFRKFDYYAKKNQPALKEIDMIKMLVEKHQCIISFVNKLNESLKYLLLIEFLLSSVNIASVAFQLIAGQAIADLGFSFSYLIVLIGQLFILALHANDIKIESIAISDAVYESPWYEKSVEIRKILLMVILRSQRPLTLTIGPFNPLTSQTVISVINGAYSYVTIMTSYY